MLIDNGANFVVQNLNFDMSKNSLSFYMGSILKRIGQFLDKSNSKVKLDNNTKTEHKLHRQQHKIQNNRITNYQAPS